LELARKNQQGGGQEVLQILEQKALLRPGAWEFIAEQAENRKTSFDQKFLKKPIGKIGYEFLIKTEYQDIYIKVRLANGIIIGRSFHPSTSMTNEED
jgi:hypothetical protein